MRGTLRSIPLSHQTGRSQLGAAPCRTRQNCRQRLTVAANLLDLLRGGGGGASSIATDADGEALKQWMLGKGLPQQKLAAARTPSSGRGLVATQPIAKGERLLHIPAHLMLTPAAAQQQSALRELLEQQPLPAWSVLALWLAEARAAGGSSSGGGADSSNPASSSDSSGGGSGSGSSSGSCSGWWPYVRLLPDATGCVLEWTPEEVEWLQGSQLHATAADIRAAAEASWQEMQPLLAAAEERGLGPAGAFSREALWWAFGMLLSRLVRLSSLQPEEQQQRRQQQEQQQGRQEQQQGRQEQQQGQEALLPFADLLNHGPAATCFLDWSGGAESAVVLQADRRYQPGEEVLVSYGQKSSGELLLSYGFCPEPGSNPHDGCQLCLQVGADDPAYDWKAAALQQHGYSASGQAFPLRMQAAPYELVHYAGFAVAAGAGLGSREEAGQLARQLFEEGDFPPDLQRAALEAVVKACQLALRAYPRSFDADRAELDALEQQLKQQQPAGAGAEAPAQQEQQQQAGAAAASAAGSRGARGRTSSTRSDPGQQQEAEEEEARLRQQQRRRQQVLQVLVYERQVLSRTVFVSQQEVKDLKRMARR